MHKLWNKIKRYITQFLSLVNKLFMLFTLQMLSHHPRMLHDFAQWDSVVGVHSETCWYQILPLFGQIIGPHQSRLTYLFIDFERNQQNMVYSSTHTVKPCPLSTLLLSLALLSSSFFQAKFHMAWLWVNINTTPTRANISLRNIIQYWLFILYFVNLTYLLFLSSFPLSSLLSSWLAAASFQFRIIFISLVFNDLLCNNIEFMPDMGNIIKDNQLGLNCAKLSLARSFMFSSLSLIFMLSSVFEVVFIFMFFFILEVVFLLELVFTLRVIFCCGRLRFWHKWPHCSLPFWGHIHF